MSRCFLVGFAMFLGTNLSSMQAKPVEYADRCLNNGIVSVTFEQDGTFAIRASGVAGAEKTSAGTVASEALSVRVQESWGNPQN